MAKKNHRQQIARQGDNQIIQTSYEEDDNMMPSPEILSNYQNLDPNFIEWFKERADLEQRARIKFNQDKIGIATSVNRKLFTIDMSLVISSSVVVILSLVLSYFLIQRGHERIGVGLTSGSILIFLVRLLNFRKAKNQEQK